jgi:hypothetical protein
MRGRVSVVVESKPVPGAGGCGGDDHASIGTSELAAAAVTSEPAANTDQVWTEQDVTFVAGADELYGISTAPGPHRAVLLAAQSVRPTDGQPLGVSDRPSTDLAQRFAEAGYAALRHDPRGVGQSGGVS